MFTVRTVGSIARDIELPIVEVMVAMVLDGDGHTVKECSNSR